MFEQIGTVIIVIVVLVVGAGLGLFAGFVLGRHKGQEMARGVKSEELEEAKTSLENARFENAELSARNAAAQAQIEGVNQQLAFAKSQLAQAQQAEQIRIQRERERAAAEAERKRQADAQAALEADPTLMDDAFSRKVALTSPVTLWAVLKSVAYAWQQQSLTDDAKQLFDLSRELYERFSTLGDYAIKLGTQITKTVSAYNKFASSLERRVLPTARKLQKIEPTKIIEEVPIIESDKGNVSELSAPEVVPADEGDTHLTASGDSLES